ncbi:MAG: DUF4124 domain-containing protein [Gammaproteobacteria bacterium]
MQRLKSPNVLLVILSLLWVFASPPLHAQTAYKWVDEEGVVHYGQNPPPGQQAEPIKPPRQPTDSEEAINKMKEADKKLDTLRQERAIQAEEQRKANEIEAAMETNCQIATRNLTELQNRGRVRSRDESGEWVIRTEEEHRAGIKKYQADIDKYCK